jgi:hypothetical protein
MTATNDPNQPATDGRTIRRARFTQTVAPSHAALWVRERSGGPG